MIKIEKKIVSYKVLSEDEKVEKVEPIVSMSEHIVRDDILTGSTYKIKPSTSNHAFYITINNIVVDGITHPYEIFINSKGIEQLRFMALCRLISAVFRKGGDIYFLVDELKEIYDPVGMYTSKRTYEGGKRKRFNSVEAEVGDIIEEHLHSIARANKGETTKIKTSSLKICAVCKAQAVVRLDGCDTCTECGDSKCA